MASKKFPHGTIYQVCDNEGKTTCGHTTDFGAPGDLVPCRECSKAWNVIARVSFENYRIYGEEGK